MKKYTLKELSIIYNCRHYLSRDRFMHYFVNRYGYPEDTAREAFKMFADFPRKIYNEDAHQLLDEILPQAIELVEEVQNGVHIPYEINQEKDYKKLVYKENDKVIEFVMDMSNSSDIIAYAGILKRRVEVIGLLPFCCRIYDGAKDKETLIFEGDLFDTNDGYWSQSNSNVYVADKNESFFKLNYIKGKGYLLDGELNRDDERAYNYHVLTLNKYAKIGNVLTHLHVLSDSNIAHLKPV